MKLITEKNQWLFIGLLIVALLGSFLLLRQWWQMRKENLGHVNQIQSLLEKIDQQHQEIKRLKNLIK